MSPPATGPLRPDAQEARRWAREELADEVYRQAEPGLLERALQALLDALARLELPDAPGSRVGLVVLALLAAAAVVVSLALAGPVRRGARRRQPGEVFDGEGATAAGHRRAADAHAAAGEWVPAVRERFRAVVRSLEERALLDASPGRTADEVASEAGVLLPDVTGALAEGARVFDDVVYGGRPATREHDALLRRLDAAVAGAAPRLGVR